MSRTRKRWPTGSSRGNRFCRTVLPMTQTALPACSSASVQIRPSVSAHCWAVKNCGGRCRSPVGGVARPQITVTTGPAARPRARRRSALSIASTSRHVEVGRLRPAAAAAEALAGRIGRMLAPSLEICSATARSRRCRGSPWRSTAATPMTMPSMVRNERSMLRRTDLANGEDDGGEEHQAALPLRTSPRRGRRGSGRCAGHRPPCRARGSPS